MGFHVTIAKISEDKLEALYSFSSFIESSDRSGTLMLNKLSGETYLSQPLPGDEAGHRFLRASVKIKRAWSSGVLPDQLEWSS